MSYWEHISDAVDSFCSDCERIDLDDFYRCHRCGTLFYFISDVELKQVLCPRCGWVVNL